MSMILDALTRAEHERQLEKQPNLKFVAPVKQRQKKPFNIWLWVILALLVNAVVLVIFLRPGENSNSSLANNSVINAQSASSSNDIATNTTANDSVVLEDTSTNISVNSESELDVATSLQSSTDRPLAMELQQSSTAVVDRPLIYEAKKTNIKQSPKTANVSSHVEQNTSQKKGAVSFSPTELSIDNAAQPIVNAPKLLIDQGKMDSTSNYVPNLKDLSRDTRNNLKQYEVNVHVFDDNPERRFVLINMDKYKQGDRISGNGPLVQEITRDGVIVDYGDGQALLPPK